MQAPTHMAGGAAAVAAYFLITGAGIQPAHIILAGMGAGAVGGLIPDIDHPNSKISHKLKPVSAIISLIFSHRGIFHTPILYLTLWALWMWKCPSPEYLMWGNFIFLGIASHLALDFLNPGGIPVLFPFESKRRHLARIKTGGAAELAVRIGLYLGLAGILAIFFIS